MTADNVGSDSLPRRSFVSHACGSGSVGALTVTGALVFIYERMASHIELTMTELISDQQLALNRSPHQQDPAFGSRDAASGVHRLPWR